MKLAVIGDEISQDHELAVDTARQLGFAAVEIRSAWETPPHQLGPEQLNAAKATVERAGLTVAGFAPPTFKHHLPRTDAELAAARDMLVHTAGQAARLGAPHVRVFSFYRDEAPDPATAAKTVGLLLAGLRLPTPLVLETGTRTNTPTVEHAVRFLDELGRDDVGILWDPGNSVFSGWTESPFPHDYRLAKGLVRHVHVKDPDGTRAYVRLGDGALDWPAILAALAADAYPGYVSLETHWRVDRELTAEERDNPWGSGFSAGGHEASVVCMQQLRSWLDRVGADV
ncbi:sugar phosphate isomerase/epimerase family protein [Nocardia sp. NPDC052566]|uniref:sugar phosphate isomerase/epimerase family protein n=1 Tax=Nocardia sp. NPDC052566 TaxID=3364330 RepID=UPI0037C56F83